VTDAQRYRRKAADCILAAERSGPAYRDLTFAIAKSWLTACQEAMDELLTIWSKAQSAAPIRLPFRFPRELRRLLFTMSARRWDATKAV